MTVAHSITWVVLHLAGVSAGNVSTQRLVVIDTDPGVDDALAIFATLGDPNYRLLAVTCVRGNTGVPNVVVNALKVLLVAQQYEVSCLTVDLTCNRFRLGVRLFIA